MTKPELLDLVKSIAWELDLSEKNRRDEMMKTQKIFLYRSRAVPRKWVISSLCIPYKSKYFDSWADAIEYLIREKKL